MPSAKSLLREYIEALLIAVLFALFARTFVVQAFKIPTGSMEKNLLVGDHILVNKFIYAPRLLEDNSKLTPQRAIRRGDVVVFKFPEDPHRDFIKRCVGLPGDRVEVLDKVLYINSKPVDESAFVQHARRNGYRPRFGPYRVPAAHYFCMGDNRDNSNDSRFWGPVPDSYVKGRAFMIYWSFDGGHEVLGWPGYRGKVQQLVGVARTFFSATRWRRSFRVVR